MIRLNPIVLHTLSTMGTRFATMFFSFGQGVIVSRALLPEGRGLIGLYTTVFGIVFALCGIRQSTAYRLGKQHANYDEIAALQFWASAVVMLVASMLMLGILYTQGLLSDWRIIVLLLIMLYVQIWETMYNGILSANREIPALNLGSLMISGVTFGVIAVSYWGFANKQLSWYFIATVLGNVVTLMYYRWRIARIRPEFSLHKQQLRAQLGNVWPFIVCGVNFALPLLILSLNYQINTLILKYMKFPVSEIGLYYQAVSIAMLIWFLPRIMAQVIFAYSVSTKNAGQFSLKLWRVMKIVMVALLPVCLVGAAVTPWLLPLIYGKEFAGSVRPFLLLLPGVYFMIAFKVLNSDFIANGRSLMTSGIFGVSLLLNLGLDWWFIPKWGICGAAAASSLSYGLATLAFVVAYRRLLLPQSSTPKKLLS